LQKQSISKTTQVADDASAYQIEFKNKMPVSFLTDWHYSIQRLFFISAAAKAKFRMRMTLFIHLSNTLGLSSPEAELRSMATYE